MIFLLQLISFAVVIVVAVTAVLMIANPTIECAGQPPNDEQLILAAVEAVASRKFIQVYQYQPGSVSLSVGQVISSTSPADIIQNNPDCCRLTRGDQQILYQPGAFTRRAKGPFAEARVQYDVTYAKQSGEQGVQRVEMDIVFDKCGNEINQGR